MRTTIGTERCWTCNRGKPAGRPCATCEQGAAQARAAAEAERTRLVRAADDARVALLERQLGELALAIPEHDFIVASNAVCVPCGGTTAVAAYTNEEGSIVGWEAWSAGNGAFVVDMRVGTRTLFAQSGDGVPARKGDVYPLAHTLGMTPGIYSQAVFRNPTGASIRVGYALYLRRVW